MTFRRGARLGVDVGSVRVGLAKSDPDGILATPIATLARDDGDVDAIVRAAAEHGAVEVVVGIPRSLDGAERAAAGHAREYAGRLAAALTIPVRLVDERLTTVVAHQAMHAAGRPGRRQRAVVDTVAATLILQSAIDQEKSTGRPAGELVDEGVN